jgi:hypothetical protein
MSTYIRIGPKITVGAGGASSINFTSIPNTYTDLVLKLSMRSSTGALYTGIGLTFNSSSSNYTFRALQGAGSGTPITFQGSSNYIGEANASTTTANTFNSTKIYIPNYAGSNYKSYSVDNVMETNDTTTYADFFAGLWSDTAAINAISIGVSNLVQYSTASLYGISRS